eukprot:812399-Pelagomonas_calceolata.AAC.2
MSRRMKRRMRRRTSTVLTGWLLVHADKAPRQENELELGVPAYMCMNKSARTSEGTCTYKTGGALLLLAVARARKEYPQK